MYIYMYVYIYTFTYQWFASHVQEGTEGISPELTANCKGQPSSRQLHSLFPAAPRIEGRVKRRALQSGDSDQHLKEKDLLYAIYDIDSLYSCELYGHGVAAKGPPEL